MNAVKTLCDSAIFLDKGAVESRGQPKDVVDLYSNVVLQKLHRGDVPFVIESAGDERAGLAGAALRSGSGEVELVSLKICDKRGDEVASIISEETLTIVYEIKALRDIEDPHYGISIRNSLGVSIFNTSTHAMRIPTAPLMKGDCAKVAYQFTCNLYPQTYSVSFGVANKASAADTSFDEYIANFYDIGIIKVLENSDSIRYSGCFNMNPSVSVDVFKREAPHA
jgi:hypothetical protein